MTIMTKRDRIRRKRKILELVEEQRLIAEIVSRESMKIAIIERRRKPDMVLH